MEASSNSHRALVAGLGVEALAHFTALPDAVDLRTADAGLTALRDDAIDALHAMGIATRSDAQHAVELEIDGASGFRMEAGATRCAVVGADVAVWSAWTQIEFWWREQGRAVVSTTSVSHPAWGAQIAQPGMGDNYVVPALTERYLDDDALCSIAHAGADGCFYTARCPCTRKAPAYCRSPARRRPSTSLGERAARDGLRLYFCMITPKLSGDDPLSIENPQVRGTKLDDPRSDYLLPVPTRAANLAHLPRRGRTNDRRRRTELGLG